jgi:hypothetical protein
MQWLKRFSHCRYVQELPEERSSVDGLSDVMGFLRALKNPETQNRACDTLKMFDPKATPLALRGVGITADKKEASKEDK